MAENASPEGPTTPASGQGSARPSDVRTLAMVCYGLYLLGFVTGLTAVIGVIIAYVKKGDAAGTIWESHFRNLIVVFWVMFAAVIFGLFTFPISLVSMSLLLTGELQWPSLSALAVPIVVWLVLLPVLVIWFLYRMIRGLIRATEDRAY